MTEKREGIILKGIGGFYEVLDASDNRTVYTCGVRGIHRKSGGITPLPGDNVTFCVLEAKKRMGHIDRIMNRKNEFIRPPVANIDRLAIVIAARSPDPDLALVDKLLITCEVKEISPLLVINKYDLDEGGVTERIRRVYAGAGYRVLLLSKVLDMGYDALHDELKGHITAFAGQSGVGKSTILNRIQSNWLMETGEVSSRINRGRHTTRHVQLVALDVGGFVVDTPGFSSYSVNDIDHMRLADCYPEFRDILGECRFSGCSHISEPGCRVRELVESGIADRRRYDGYIQLYKELKEAYDNRYRR
jgi:ribosome biogenesis GTPase